MNLISERDKKLIIFMAMVAVILLPYFLYVQPTIKKNDTLRQEIAALKDTRTQLESKAMQAEFYRSEILRMTQDEGLILSHYPSSWPEEANLSFIHETENLISIELYQAGFGEDGVSPIIAAADTAVTESTDPSAAVEVNDATEAVAAAEADAAETEADAAAVIAAEEDGLNGGTAETTETVSLSSELNGISITNQFSYRSGYQALKEFLVYIRDYVHRKVITNITMSYSPEDGMVSGSFSMIQYAVSGSGRPPIEIERPEIPQGTTNIFMTAAGGAGTAEAAADTYDFFILLNRPEATMDAKIIGQADDAAQTTYLVSDENNEEEITVTFEGENGQYTAVYNIGDTEIGGEPPVLYKDGPIYLEIIAAPRGGDGDEVEAAVNVINHTDQAVYVNVIEDDTDNTRVNIVGRTGSVMVSHPNGDSFE